MSLLKFFNIILEYTNDQENYTEPAKTEKTIISNILYDELYSISNKKLSPLKCFTIYHKE